MSRVRREAEAIMLAMVAALPLYFTAAIDIPSIVLFHLAMGAILGAEIMRPGFVTPRIFLRMAAISYLLFYFFDSAILSRSLIRGTAHLLFFIAAYQSLDRSATRRVTQRLLVTFLIAVASIATATHITILIFVIIFAFLTFRQLISLSRQETLRLVGMNDDERPPGRVAATYIVPMIVIAGLLFPFMPRVRDPFVRGFSSSLQTSTGFSDMIDMSDARTISTDPRVVARVRMSREAMQFFAPVRLRGGHYDRYVNDKWRSSRAADSLRYVRHIDENTFVIAEPRSNTGTINVQQARTSRDNQKLYLPVGTYKVIGVANLREGYNVGSYFVPGRGEPLLSYDVEVSERIDRLRPDRDLPEYPVSDEIRRLADEIAASATTTRENAVVIERYLATRYEYVANAERREPINAESFLLDQKRGHCEHFAAGMVLLLAARGVPARIAGGYYGGELNPLTGYFVLRQRDAHAWVEVWEDGRWITYDPTPPDLRPGSDTPNVFMAYLTALTDSVNFFWDRYILTFGLRDQINIILTAFWNIRDALDSLRRGMMAAPSIGRVVAWITGALLIVIIGALVILRPRFRRSIFERLVTKLRRAGIVVRQEMTTGEILEEVERLRPQLLAPVKTIVEHYRRERFSPAGSSPELSGAALNALRMISEARR